MAFIGILDICIEHQLYKTVNTNAYSTDIASNMHTQ